VQFEIVEEQVKQEVAHGVHIPFIGTKESFMHVETQLPAESR
jgi:hypothetical protein